MRMGAKLYHIRFRMWFFGGPRIRDCAEFVTSEKLPALKTGGLYIDVVS
jgi:hypothetical protein